MINQYFSDLRAKITCMALNNLQIKSVAWEGKKNSTFFQIIVKLISDKSIITFKDSSKPPIGDPPSQDMEDPLEIGTHKCSL